MGRVQSIVLILLVGAILVVVAFGEYETKVTRWDYAVLSIKDEELTEMMKSIGENGWELVFARRAARQKDTKEQIAEYEKTGKMSETEPLYEMIFKRPKSRWSWLGRKDK